MAPVTTLASALLLLAGPRGQEDAAAGLVGTTARPFVLPGLQGESVRFPPDPSSTARLSVLVFWATWSQPSGRELERLAQLWPRWSQSGVQVVAVNVEGPLLDAAQSASVRTWIAERSLPYPVAVDVRLRTFRDYGVVAVPTTFVVDPSGLISMRLPGFPIAGAERLIDFVESRLVLDGEAAEPLSAFSAPHRRALRYVGLARLLVRRGETEMAVYTLEKAVAEAEQLVDARIDLARLHDQLGRSDQADLVLQAAAAALPGDPLLLLEQANLSFRHGNQALAEARARDALERNPSLGPAMTLMGLIRRSRGDRAGALAAFEEATRLNPFDPEPVLGAAQVLEEQAEAEAALRKYEEAYELLRSDAEDPAIPTGARK